MLNQFVLKRLKDLLWVLVISAVVVGTGRMVFGLGASTNMLDVLPWGLWKVFNMIAGAALATSGFVVAAFVYIVRAKRYYPVAKLSVILGFLGYTASLVALIFDIGLPHRGWHPFFMWNPHSFLFEVFWCVSIYWSVTALELLPILSERFPFPKVTHFLHDNMLPFVVLGITLSTMHHSSLGSLFLASPTRLHPLWYSLWIPPEFFISAMGAGLATIVLALLAISWLYGKPRNENVTAGLAGISAVFLVVFLVVRLLDLTVHHKWNYVFGPDVSWETRVFQVEVLLQAIVPILAFSLARFRRSTPMLYLGSVAALVGLIMHRLDVGIVGYFSSAGAIYTPNLSEMLLSFGVLGAAGLLFFFFIERFPVLAGVGFEADAEIPADADEATAALAAEEGGQGAGQDEGHHGPVRYWSWSEARAIFFGEGAFRVVGVAMLVIPLALISLREQATGAYRAPAQPVFSGVQAQDAMRDVLLLDANRSGEAVIFPHLQHQVSFQEKYGITKEETCARCHHLSLPEDHNSTCRSCHRDMALPTPIFDPERHLPRFEDEAQRAKFEALDLDDREENYAACMMCHEKSMVGLVEYQKTGFSYLAPGFEQAMHGKCMTCHRLEEKNAADSYSTGNCLGCHRPPPKVMVDGELRLPEMPAESRPSPDDLRRGLQGPVFLPTADAQAEAREVAAKLAAEAAERLEAEGSGAAVADEAEEIG
jgi:Ni/Fe-hydrogenase subunit HybB-like protein